jgi:hypothetical protein
VTEAEPQVSWMAIERDATVVAADGSEAGRVLEIAGDREADIFDGLVVALSALGAGHHLPAERVTAIWPRRVEVDLTPEEVERLPAYREPVVGSLPRESGFRRFVRRLFGGRA